MHRYFLGLALIGVLAGLLLLRDGAPSAADAAQAQAPSQPQSPPTDRFLFDVVESFDAKYPGDTPGHIGRHGGLGELRPRIALGDKVFRGEVDAPEIVGVVTNLKWSRAQGSLDIEFDPDDSLRIEIGESVWVKLGGSPPAKK